MAGDASRRYWEGLRNEGVAFPLKAPPEAIRIPQNVDAVTSGPQGALAAPRSRRRAFSSIIRAAVTLGESRLMLRILGLACRITLAWCRTRLGKVIFDRR
jgi:hypothetical protein